MTAVCQWQHALENDLFASVVLLGGLSQNLLVVAYEIESAHEDPTNQKDVH